MVSLVSVGHFEELDLVYPVYGTLGTAEGETPEPQGVPFFACCRYTCGRHQTQDSPEERTVRSRGPGTVAVEAPKSQGGLLFCCQRQQAVGLQGQSRVGHQNRKGCRSSPAVVIPATTAKQAPRDSRRKDTPSAPGRPWDVATWGRVPDARAKPYSLVGGFPSSFSGDLPKAHPSGS
ncbi:hypothetical protein HPB47_016282 [Ixodes persulcatus]|uniref:Uncharacterized protein n=1 Tax=Ixodes persulcatus TaxID=34615 RepID=A0AC60R3C3_IXOPE|nr:hypothetical protein HPB47_016282 [Ixodes persulcatus]